jgi:hypothetical protein
LISETWLNGKFDNSLLLSNYPYSLIRSDRHEAKNKGGGVCIFISHSLAFQTVEIPKIPNSNIAAIDLFDINSSSTHRIILVYRPTTSESNEHFNIFADTLGDLLNVNYPVSLIGDFNFPNLLWNNGYFSTATNTLSTKEQTFSQLIHTFDLYQYIDFPTRGDNYLISYSPIRRRVLIILYVSHPLVA